MIKKIISNTIVILVLAVIIGILTGLFIPKAGMKSVLVLKQISGQVIFFLVPMIIIGFVAPSIASLKGNVSRLIVFAFLLAYLSSVGAAFCHAGRISGDAFAGHTACHRILEGTA